MPRRPTAALTGRGPGGRRRRVDWKWNGRVDRLVAERNRRERQRQRVDGDQLDRGRVADRRRRGNWRHREHRIHPTRERDRQRVRDGSLPTGPSGVTGASAVTEDIGRELGPDIPTIRALRRGLAGMVAVLPQEAPRVVTLNKDLLTAESTDLTEAQRQGLLAQIQKAITKVTSLITLPRSSSITLTSTKGEIPLTVLSSRRCGLGWSCG